MWRRLVSLANRGGVLGVVLAVVSFTASGVTAQTPQSQPPAPARMFVLALSFDDAWIGVEKSVASSQFNRILSDDPVQRRLVALTPEVPVKVFVGKRSQRHIAKIELREFNRGTYGCYIDVQLEELWPVNKDKWTTTKGADVSDFIITLSETIARELRRPR